jgi:D-xylose transport system ATP-binding protein
VERSVRLREISFHVHAGEILGIGGLMGAGRSELLMHLYGLWGTRTTGKVWLEEVPYPRPLPRESLRRGLMLVTEDRKRWGLIPGQSAHHNVSLSSLPAVSRHGWIDTASEHRRNAAMLARARFRALSDQTPVERLSGGNQQKVVLARGLLCEPRVILLDEPTRGVDVAARREIYEEAQSLANQGQAVLWVSSELPELMGICDRIAMMHEGTIAGIFSRDEGFDSTRLMELALG